MYRTLEEVPVLVRNEYAKHAYTFAPPDVSPSNWSAVAWINYVTFDNLNPETHLWARRGIL
jgi:hypothetical protein